MIPRRSFYVLRHGQTEWNREGRYQGHADIPLNETGLGQAHAAAKLLTGAPIDRIVVSPLIRALNTAAIVAEALARPLHVERGLIERSFGSFEGLVIRETKLKHGVSPDQSAPSILPADADRWDEILERVPPVIGGWLTRCPGETLLFVAHSGVFDAVHAHLMGPRVGAESKHAHPYQAVPTDTGWRLDPLGA